jgi:hypothetical protein
MVVVPFFPPFHPFTYSKDARSMFHGKDLPLFLHALKSSAKPHPIEYCQ